ncbi:MerR family transcriptional regulator [Anaerolinea sp.]|uniref:MerR family transcriptional regulator n=1 Tax=Anaerolinea sp. TaxID=1872519 RepID=UPI002ACEEE86|nr:MerR family transcriptional regulator [Anaerolinea sp.]
MEQESERNTPNRIPMRELERLTGLTRMTINFYIREGLLPEPHKTARNMAYYTTETVNRLCLIHQLRSRYDLSLTQIRELLAHSLEENLLSLVLEVRHRVFRPGAPTRGAQTVSRQELLHKTGLSEAQLQRLIELKLIYPERDDETAPEHFHSDSVVMGQLIQRFAQEGITLDEIEPIARALQEITRLETEIYHQTIASADPQEGKSPADDPQRVQVLVELASLFIALAHLHTLYHQMNGGEENETPSLG